MTDDKVILYTRKKLLAENTACSEDDGGRWVTSNANRRREVCSRLGGPYDGALRTGVSFAGIILDVQTGHP